ncbi:MAG TPA: sigma-70 family RNA polymerase sigma factor [Limnobacter sp.]|nr:sigma-70 family RNA polymerase sigma factor [Limnobacter sp.]
MTSNSAPDEFEAKLKPLWARAQEGDSVAYRDALSAIAKRLRQYFGRRLQGLPDEVEDLVQETLIALHLQRGTYDSGLPVSSWVFAIARHKLVDLWRRRGRREALHDNIDDIDELELPNQEEAHGTGRDLMSLLAQLPKAQQLALTLTKIEGLSMQEASLRTGVSVPALKVQVHRGLKRLSALVGSNA